MFDQIKAIAYAFSGQLKGEETLRRYVWAFMVAIAFTFIILFYNSFMSLAFWKEQLERFAGIDGNTGAYVVTVCVAFAAYFLLSSFTGTVLDFIHKRGHRTQEHISMFIAVFLALALLVWLDIHANLSGVTVVSHTTTQQVQQNTTDQKYDKVQAEINEKESELKNLLAGNLGGYGWFDNGGKWHLNSSGKKYQRALSEDIKALRGSQKYLMDVAQQQYNNDVQRYTTTVQQKESNHTYLVFFAYPLALILSFFTNHFSDRCIYHVEGEASLQVLGNVRRNTENTENGRSQVSEKPIYRSQRSNGQIGFKNYVGANDGTHRSKVGPGQYEIQCLNCGTTAIKHSIRAKFCCDDCRIEYWNNKNGTKLIKGKPR